MTDEKKQQYTLKISQASRTQLVVILYEMTLDYLKEAEDAAGSRDEAAFHTGIKRARACIHELSHSLNHEYPLCGQDADPGRCQTGCRTAKGAGGYGQKT